MRLDKYLAENGFADSRTRAAQMIAAGLIQVNGILQKKPSYDLPDDAVVEVVGELLPYVSRGGLKLKGALDTFGISPKGMISADIGASTGGFTDCLLQEGAIKVYAIDSGKDQLHEKLRGDSRVVSMESFNARNLTLTHLGEAVDIAVTDVSFISQTLLHGAIASILKDGGIFLSLIKPQFEVGRENLGKGGIVKNPKARREAARRVMTSAMTVGLAPIAITVSPITGGDGNIEYLAYFRKQQITGILPEVDHLP
ncbi:MAG: TlyA family RNA methyltransferase [Clostridia bacterium]|nr:TlyA family RNA methyltransferase [Clostridia bacterium]